MEPENQTIHYRVHNTLPLVPILSQVSTVHALLSCFLKFNLILSSHLCIGCPSGLFSSGFPTKHCIHLSFPSYLSCAPPAPFCMIISCREYVVRVQIMKLVTVLFSLVPCYFLHFMPKLLSQHPVLEHTLPVLVLQCERETKFCTYIKQRPKL